MRLNLTEPIELTASLVIDDPYVVARLEEHVAPIEGEIVGGRWDGLAVVYHEPSGSADGRTDG